MNTTLHSFMDIFGAEYRSETNHEPVILQKIVIPIIQRDYAQGRLNPEVNRVRTRFLDSLFEAVEDKPIILDFVYGDIDENGVMTPLDGQQRLTTLFLLHWYAAKKAGVSDSESSFLSNFGYETRPSARQFCRKLFQFKPSFTTTLSKEIGNQAWCPLAWQDDPTIHAMLVMLDSIDEKFKTVDNLWDRLKNGAITFYFLPIKDMGLTDELYIKMNSRGKPLTLFEHFKAELEKRIQAVDDRIAKDIARKIDRKWTDMLWLYRDSGYCVPEDEITDDEFLNYFRFICDVICFQNEDSPQRSSDVFDLQEEFFSGNSETVLKNVEMLDSYFNCWCQIEGYDNPTSFLESYISYDHQDGKIVIDSRYKINIFEECLHSYGEKFPTNRTVLLYAIICFLRNRDSVSYSDFYKRLRSINNLIQNSEDEVTIRLDNNRIPAILQQTETIMLTGEIDDSIKNNFNGNQLVEEKEKKEFLEKRPELADYVYILEDHPNLKGQIGIIGLDYIEYANRFVSLFSCDWDLIDRALMTVGDYGQQESHSRYQYGSTMQVSWDELFHKSANKGGFEKTRSVLISLLSKAEVFTDEFLREVISDYLKECEKTGLYTWRYYYVKYDEFHPGSYGKLSNSDRENKPYLFSVMQTRSQWSSNTYMPYLKAADDSHLSKDWYGQRLIYDIGYVICENDAFVLIDNETEKEIDRIRIDQNDEGIDAIDRILLLKDYIKKLVTD